VLTHSLSWQLWVPAQSLSVRKVVWADGVPWLRQSPRHVWSAASQLLCMHPITSVQLRPWTHASDTQAWPASQVPQSPPQPSSPQVLPSHWGAHVAVSWATAVS